MVTNEMIEILVTLLDGARQRLLSDSQRAQFIEWLHAHTKLEFQSDAFKEQMSNWLSGFDDPQEFYADVLIIHSEIVWISAQRGLK